MMCNLTEQTRILQMEQNAYVDVQWHGIHMSDEKKTSEANLRDIPLRMKSIFL